MTDPTVQEPAEPGHNAGMEGVFHIPTLSRGKGYSTADRPQASSADPRQLIADKHVHDARAAKSRIESDSARSIGDDLAYDLSVAT